MRWFRPRELHIIQQIHFWPPNSFLKHVSDHRRHCRLSSILAINFCKGASGAWWIARDRDAFISWEYSSLGAGKILHPLTIPLSVIRYTNSSQPFSMWNLNHWSQTRACHALSGPSCDHHKIRAFFYQFRESSRNKVYLSDVLFKRCTWMQLWVIFFQQ